MADTIIESVQEYITAYAGLESNAPVWVNKLLESIPAYSIDPLPGGGIVAKDVIGNTERKFVFALHSVKSTADKLATMANIGFYEAFSDWLENQSKSGMLPNLGIGKTPTRIEVLGQGYLYEQGESNTGVYQVQCALYYEQEA